MLHHTEQEAKAAARSLQAFVHYHHLYEHWWSNPAQIQSRADSSPADSDKDKAVNGVSGEPSAGTVRSDKEDFDASLLLSEPHAAYQATQRSVRGVQEQLSAMMSQHRRAQGGRLDPVEKETDATTQSSVARESSDVQECADSGQQ